MLHIFCDSILLKNFFFLLEYFIRDALIVNFDISIFIHKYYMLILSYFSHYHINRILLYIFIFFLSGLDEEINTNCFSIKNLIRSSRMLVKINEIILTKYEKKCTTIWSFLLELSVAFNRITIYSN